MMHFGTAQLSDILLLLKQALSHLENDMKQQTKTPEMYFKEGKSRVRASFAVKIGEDGQGAARAGESNSFMQP